MKNWDIDISLHDQLITYAEQLFEQGAYEHSIAVLAELGAVEAKYYIGYLASIRMECLLKKIGKRLFPKQIYPKKTASQRKVLHLATELYNVGGHARVLKSWVTNDVNSTAEILVLDQQADINMEMPVPIHFLAEQNDIERAKALRDFLANNYFDIIVLHQKEQDCVPNIALWDLKENSDTLVLYFNHANFRFSFGNTIADKRINFNRGDMVISARYRYPLEECFLPFILGKEPVVPWLEQKKKEERANLGLNYKTVLMAIGTAYKYAQFKDQNFFEEWNAFLNDHPDCVLVVIGPALSDFKKNCPNISPVDNLKLMGKIIDPTIYYKIADYVVDAYPLPTGLGMQEAVFHGATPILSYGEGAVVMGAETRKLYPDALLALLTYTNRAEYFEFITKELETGAYKTAVQPIIENYIEEYMLLSSWQRQLETIYNSPIIHQPEPKKIEDILNTSTASKNWYEYANDAVRSFALIEVCFKVNMPFKWAFLKQYLRLVMRYRSIRGSRLKIFINYCLGKYKQVRE